MPTVSPESVGMSSSRLRRLDAAMQRCVDEGKLAGVVTLLSRRGQVFHAGCYGLADRERRRPMQPNTLFRLWSVTKAITTVAALTLYEQGYFALDQDIAAFIPAFRETMVYTEQGALVDKTRPITIRQLMTHSAGLASALNRLNVPPENDMVALVQAAHTLTLAEIVKAMARIPLVFQPNTTWYYSLGFEVVARLVEIISGQPFAAYVQDHIFGPLGMADTGYVVRLEHRDRFSTLYTTAEDGTLKVIETAETSPHCPDQDAQRWTPGSFGLVSTPDDLLRFTHMLYHRGTLDGVRVLAPRTVDLMASNHLPPALLPYQFFGGEPFYGYGHGLGVHTLMDRGLAGTLCSNGEYWKDGGAGTLFWVDPVCELTGVVLYQLDPFWIHPIFATVKALAYQAMEE